VREDDDDDYDDENEPPPPVTGPIQWLTVDPGRQYIGSFHPESQSLTEWEAGVYITGTVAKVPTSTGNSDNTSAIPLQKMQKK
jgi:hypothetical protein